jgi:aerobic-type carbon monoxide dehydrogenase small subunit (CoxS/CutS family)
MQFTLNGKKVQVELSDPAQTLNDYLRDDVGLTGTKICCGMAVCRVCTVAVQEGMNASPEPTRSCITPLATLEGKEVLTVEGLANGDELHPLQKAFLENFSFQCGYSTPGFLMASYCLVDRLRRKPIPKSEVENAIQDAVGQHICRCTGYVRYHNAIRQVILETPGLTT